MPPRISYPSRELEKIRLNIEIDMLPIIGVRFIVNESHTMARRRRDIGKKMKEDTETKSVGMV